MNDHPLIPKSNSKIVPPFIPKPKESLEAENERLKEEIEHIKFWNDQLKAENDLLRKSGDAMHEELGNFAMTWRLRDAWNAAKEGKQDIDKVEIDDETWDRENKAYKEARAKEGKQS